MTNSSLNGYLNQHGDRKLRTVQRHTNNRLPLATNQAIPSGNQLSLPKLQKRRTHHS